MMQVPLKARVGKRGEIAFDASVPDIITWMT
jgi:hypothetical protein